MTSIDHLTLPEKAAYYATQDFDAIPIIDLQDAASPDFSKRKAVAMKLQKACLTAGFFYVKNHGVDEAVADKAFGTVKEFFLLPGEVKQEIDVSKHPKFKGWSGVLHTRSGDNKAYAGDRLESYNLGMSKDLAKWVGGYEGQEAGMEGLGENQWLEEGEWEGAGAFKLAMYEWFREVLALGKRMLPLFALALDLEEDYFADKTRTNFVNQRLLYYPPLEGQPADPTQPGIGAHTDWQLFTILRQDDVGGLEVRNLSGEWISAAPIPGTFVINIGNQLQRWTNHVFRSTLHRVVPPPAHVARQSSPMFFGADEHVPLVPIPTCVSAERPFGEEVITAGEYVQRQLVRAYGPKARPEEGVQSRAVAVA